MATIEETDKADAKPALAPPANAKYKPGFRADESAYPGVDPDTGERKAVTYRGLQEEFGKMIGARLYNDIAVTGFGGVQKDRPPLAIVTLLDEKYKRPIHEGETEEDYEKAMGKREERVKRLQKVLADAEAARAKEA